ncbi:hypothetical protein C7S18_17700 [Ahniella affigens]|uniref:Uncharacterized protein n=2 Tax=Ahniella affigens TaxID=2021234 RepID=A0A2P1PVM8_9GAMM|nr:hypothetical protein C7S18_17700 [Ahniella affigens]
MGNELTLSVGFGQLIPSKRPSRVDDPDPEWWLGTYYGTWRIMKGDEILCGSFDAARDRAWLVQRIGSIAPGAFQSLTQASPFDLRLDLSNGIAIDFMWTTSEVEDLFMVFGPNDLYLTFGPQSGWRRENRFAQR